MMTQTWTLEADVAEISGGPHDGYLYLVPRGRNKIILFRGDTVYRSQVERDLEFIKAVAKDIEVGFRTAPKIKTRPNYITGDLLEAMARLRAANPYLYVRDGSDGRSTDGTKLKPLKIPECRENDVVGVKRHRFKMATAEQYKTFFKFGGNDE